MSKDLTALADIAFLGGRKGGISVTLQTVQMYRVLVALLIAASHAIDVLNQRGFIGLGFLKTRTGGVDFFFTLSGFLIYYIYSKYRGDPLVVRTFLFRRFLRIYPLVWFFTLLSLPVYFFVSDIGRGDELQVSYILKSMLLLPQQSDPILGATWSLSHVVLFYLFFSLYLWRPLFSVVLIKGWLIIFIIHLFFPFFGFKNDDVQTLFNFVFSPFNFEFLAGCLLAKVMLKKKGCCRFSSIALGCFIFAASWFFAEKNSSQVTLTALFCSASLILIFGGIAIDRKYKFQLPKVAEIVGSSSYAIIVVNLPVIVALSRFEEFILEPFGQSLWLSWFLVFFGVIAAVFFGVFTAKVIEPLMLRLFSFILIGSKAK